MRNQLRAALVLISLIGAGIAVTAAGPAPLRRDADLLKQKVTAIRSRGVAGLAKRTSTTISEKEVNAYLAYELADDLPAGVVDPSVTILGPNRVAGRAVVDLDRVRAAANPTSLLDPMYYLTGRVPVSAVGRLQALGGTGRFALESADVAGLPIPKLVLQKIVSYYSRSVDRPDGIDLDSSFELPARIREIRVDRGQAIVVQ